MKRFNSPEMNLFGFVFGRQAINQLPGTGGAGQLGWPRGAAPTQRPAPLRPQRGEAREKVRKASGSLWLFTKIISKLPCDLQDCWPPALPCFCSPRATPAPSQRCLAALATFAEKTSNASPLVERWFLENCTGLLQGVLGLPGEEIFAGSNYILA